jgi:hypothetical protein
MPPVAAIAVVWVAFITILFFAAFFTGGLSETVGALHISILGLALAATFLGNKGPSRRAALALITSALTGALLAMFGMFITPANAMRLNGTETPSLLAVIPRALAYAAQFLAEAAVGRGQGYRGQRLVEQGLHKVPARPPR